MSEQEPKKPEIQLKKVLVGGKPVGWDNSTGTLHLAGEEVTLEQWQEIERRINLFYSRKGLIKDPRKNKGSDPNSGTSSFLTNNVRQILDREVGIMKNPPFWLKWLYSGVITKERYSRD